MNTFITLALITAFACHLSSAVPLDSTKNSTNHTNTDRDLLLLPSLHVPQEAANQRSIRANTPDPDEIDGEDRPKHSPRRRSVEGPNQNTKPAGEARKDLETAEGNMTFMPKFSKRQRSARDVAADAKGQKTEKGDGDKGKQPDELDDEESSLVFRPSFNKRGRN